MSYCPKCGADAADGQNYCRKCGVNLALVTKAVNLGEVIARGDSGLLPKIRIFMGNMKLDDVSEQVGRHLEKINESLMSANRDTVKAVRETRLSLPDWGSEPAKPKPPKRAKKQEDRRSKLLAEGFPSFFLGIALMVFLFVFGDMLVFRIPPEKAARIPFDVAEAAKIAWLIGLIPTLSGLGKLVAAGFIKAGSESGPVEDVGPPQLASPPEAIAFDAQDAPPSVTEHTTARLGDHAPDRMRAHE